MVLIKRKLKFDSGVSDFQMLKAGVLCSISGFHGKFLEDFVSSGLEAYFSECSALDVIPHFRKISKIKKFMYDSKLGRSLQKIVLLGKSGMRMMDFVLSDDEVQTLWLFLDVILSVKLGNKSFVVSTSMFNYLISEVKYMEKDLNGKSEFYKLLVDIEETLGQVGFALSEENFKLKLIEAEKKKLSEFYDMEVFEAGERHEFDKGVKIAEWFLENIKQPKITGIAEKHKCFLGDDFDKMYYNN